MIVLEFLKFELENFGLESRYYKKKVLKSQNKI